MSDAQRLQDKGVKLFKQHDYEEAARAFQEAQTAYEVAGDTMLAAEMQVNAGLVHRALGENQRALDVMQEALLTFQEANDEMRTAKALGNLGGVYAALGDKEQAYNCYRQAADIFKAHDENKLYGETLIAMGDLQMRDGKLSSGAASYEAGLENLDELSGSQKVIKGLMGIRNRLTGGGKA